MYSTSSYNHNLPPKPCRGYCYGFNATIWSGYIASPNALFNDLLKLKSKESSSTEEKMDESDVQTYTDIQVESYKSND